MSIPNMTPESYERLRRAFSGVRMTFALKPTGSSQDASPSQSSTESSQKQQSQEYAPLTPEEQARMDIIDEHIRGAGF